MGIHFQNKSGKASNEFDNTGTSLTADTLPAAISELSNKLDSLPATLGYKADKVTPQEFIDYSSTRSRDTDYLNDTGAQIFLFLWTTISSSTSGIRVTITPPTGSLFTVNSSTTAPTGGGNNRQALQTQ